MQLSRHTVPGHKGTCSFQLHTEGGTTPLEALPLELAWLKALPPPETTGPAPQHELPFQPRSFRDCMLYEQHWIDASRGFVRRFMPWALPATSAYEKIARRSFPAFRPPALTARQPVYYMGNHLSFVPSGTPVRPPPYSQALDYELELGWVLRKPLRDASPQEALDAIGGFVVVNDWSARDVQRPEMASGFGPQKSKHFMSSMSRTMATPDGLLNRIESLEARVEINGRCVTRSATAGMCHSIGTVLAHISQGETLWPGELIASGTLPGGSGMETGHWLKPGDHLRLVIDDIGDITHDILS